MNIAGVTGITAAQRAALKVLGAIELDPLLAKLTTGSED
jgi:hypothetical protein